MTSEKKSPDQHWDVVIEPGGRWYAVDLSELWQYRELVGMFIKRDFVTFYKQTILGPLWYIIQPLFTTLVFTVIFGKVAQISTDDLPPFLFYMAGNVMWSYFSATLMATSDTFNANAAIFSKVYFPRLTVPISIMLVNFLQFFIQFTLFICFYIYFWASGAPVKISGYAFFLPLLLIHMAIASFGCGVLISTLTTKYKDLKFAMSFLVQLWMYATPVVYPLSMVPDSIRKYYILNPMVSIIEVFKMSFLGTSSIKFSEICISVLVTICLLITGVILFSRIEKNFIDTI